MTYTLRHGIPSMTSAQFAALRALPVPKLVVHGADDPQMSASDEATTAGRIGAAAGLRARAAPDDDLFAQASRGGTARGRRGTGELVIPPFR